jgi:hypothetical protein
MEINIASPSAWYIYIYINICIAILLLGLKVSIKNWNSFHESPEATSAANLDMVQNFTQLCLSMARHREICLKKGDKNSQSSTHG